MSLLAIYNPISGDSEAEQFFNTHVIPRLRAANRIPTEIVRTRAPGDAGMVVLSFLNRCQGDITVVLGSGDGTLHEIVNHLAFATDAHDRPTPEQGMVAYKLRSLEAFLGASTPRPLSLSITSLDSHPDQGRSSPVASVVVTSTSLHAAILEDSEKLRKDLPGVERFKVAAWQNMTKWFASHVRLLPVLSSGVVLAYDPGKGDFVPSGDSNEGDLALDLHGPFVYFISTMNVDRLEPEFRINPTISKNPPTSSSMDVVIVRPQRDPTFTSDTPQTRAKFAEKMIAVFTTAYQDGIHINLRYSENGDITEGGDRNTVIECFRCGGWEWAPDETDQRAHLLCVDGAIFEIEIGGQATCRAASGTDATLRDFYVHV